MTEEKRIVLKNVGKINPLKIDDYKNADGFIAFEKALNSDPENLLNTIINSGLRGRGGAGFPTGIKNRATKQSCSDCTERYIICNADEGEPGTFKDRIIMENDPFVVIEGMMIAAFIVGSNKGYIYIRGEYYESIDKIANAIESCRKEGLLGNFIKGSNFSFDIEIKIGAGSYLCGEELTLIESLEGNRGYPRIKPPFPAEKGLYGKPTLINNVETLATIPSIVLNGADWYRSMGTEKSPGTKIFTLSGRIARPGFYEVELGLPLHDLVFIHGGGMLPGYSFKGALLGGAAGTFVDNTMLNVPMAYETLKEKGATLGSGAVIVIDNTQEIKKILQSVIRFFKHESCGKCVPCRVGCADLMGISHELTKNNADPQMLIHQLETISLYMAANSLCPLGQSPVMPIRSAIKYFKNELISTDY